MSDKNEIIGGFKKFRNKMSPIIELETEKLQISEYNTRCRFVDEKQVSRLMGLMEENGFIPNRAIWVNIITEDGTREGKILQYRVAAGRHRHEAAHRLNFETITSQPFYNLTPEEECELDRLDNKLDNSNEPINFLAEAEHLKFLQEVKKWSVRKISRHTGIKKSDVGRKLQIANLPDTAKKIIKLSPRGDSFFEAYFREICKLKKESHIVTVCSKIAERAEMAANKVKVKGRDNKLKPIQPMKQSEIEDLVYEYLKKEKKGIVETPVKVPVARQLDLFPREEEEETQEEEYITKMIVTIEKREEQATQAHNPEPAEPLPEIPSEVIGVNIEKMVKGLKADMFPKWVRSTGIVKELGASTFMVMEMIGEYALWFTSKKEDVFFLNKEIYDDPLSHLAEGAGLTKEHLQKKILPDLKKLGFIDYDIVKGEYRFRFIWDRLIEIYRKTAHKVPFIEGGFKNISSEFSGIIRITPYHYIGVSKGTTIQIRDIKAPVEDKTNIRGGEPGDHPAKEEQEKKQEAPHSGNGSLLKALIEELGLARAEAERIIGKYPHERIEKALKLSKDKERPAGWFLKALEDNYNLKSVKEKEISAEFRKEADNCFRNCSGSCASIIENHSKGDDACFWCKKFDSIREKFLLRN